MKVKFVFHLKRGIIDDNEIDDEESLDTIAKTKKLLLDGFYNEAIAFLRSKIFFEWIWTNGDGDPLLYFESDEEFQVTPTEDNCDMRIFLQDNELILTVYFEFFLDVRDGVDLKDLHNWMYDNSMYSCGYIGDGWLYKFTEGDNVWIDDVHYK